VEEINEEDRALYLRKYWKKLNTLKCLIIWAIPIYGAIYATKKVEESWNFKWVVWVGFDENWEVIFVTNKEDEKFLKVKYNLSNKQWITKNL
jgi:hypothetical protein